jgi:hypothetical protein
VNDFSDPSWWPTPPPKPPKAVSTPKLVFGTLLPVAIGVVALVVLLTNKHHKQADAADGRSIAAFTACMKEQGADSPSVQANTRMLNLDAIACKDHLPKGVQLPNFSDTGGGDQAGGNAFQQCMQSAYVNLRGNSGGRIGSGSRKAFQDAVSLCRSLTQRPGASAPT